MITSHKLLCVLIALTVWLLTEFSHNKGMVLAQTAPVAGVEERDRGIELYRKKNFVEAAKLLKKAVEKNKQDEQSWYYLGLALTPQPKEPKNATKAFECDQIKPKVRRCPHRFKLCTAPPK